MCAQPNKKERKVVMGTPKLNRWIRIVKMLRKNRGRSCDELSTLFDVDRRDIFRDIRDLKKMEWPIVYSRIERRYVFSEDIDPKTYVDLLKTLAPDFLDDSVVKDYLKALDPFLLKQFLAEFNYIPYTEPDEKEPPRIMSFATSELIISRQPSKLSPYMREKLDFLIEPLSQLDATARNKLFDSLSL